MRLSILALLLLPLFAFSQNHGDSLRKEINLDQVYSQYNLHGEDVIVAFIERGIDYTHPDFIDDNGNTRIAYIYDMINTAGANAPNNPYGVGTIFDSAQINQALRTSTALGSTDRYGHGTACTGIAAGDGSGMASRQYRGVADKATIIAVKILHDGFPARPGVSAQAGFYDPTFIPIALDFVKDKSIALGLPSVTLMNLGSIGGPTDGTSKITRAMSDFAAPGRILVCGVGDDGGGTNRAGATLSQGGTIDLEIEKAVAGNLRLEIWYPGSDRFTISIKRPNNTTAGPFSGPATNQTREQQFITGLNYYHLGSDQDFDEATNGQRQVLIDLTGPTGRYTVTLTGATITDGAFTASLNPSTYSWANRFVNNVVSNGSICDFASAQNIIVPTSYVLKNNWIDLNGVQRSRINEGDPGEIWVGSSTGPTRDGRRGVDVAVPGEVNICAYSPNTYYGSFDFNKVQNSNGLYGVQSAVSSAAPVCTGVLALMLEVKSDLSPAEAKDILQRTARSDANTGTVPNVVWGHGKLDALGAVNASRALVSINDNILSEVQLFPNPFDTKLTYDLGASAQGTIEIWNNQGKLVQQHAATEAGYIETADLSPGLYFVKVGAKGQLHWKKMIKR
ncbi:MAG: S8 family peptidase [Bacteroidia bacterium]